MLLLPRLLGACQAAVPGRSWPLGSLLPDACNRNHQRVSSSLCLPSGVSSAQPKRTPQRAVHPNATFLFRDALELKIPREMANRTKHKLQAPVTVPSASVRMQERAFRGEAMTLQSSATPSYHKSVYFTRGFHLSATASCHGEEDPVRKGILHRRHSVS